jgi:hypothetical protein
MKMNLNSIIMTSYAVMILLTTQEARAVTAEEFFEPKLNGKVIKGTYVRKGTLAATFANIQALDKLLNEPGTETEVARLMKDQEPLSRALYAVDLFEMQPVETWLKDSAKQGKILVAVMALKESPELMTNNVKNRLNELAQTSHPTVKAEILNVLS